MKGHACADMDGCVCGWMDGRMDGWMCGWMDGWMIVLHAMYVCHVHPCAFMCACLLSAVSVQSEKKEGLKCSTFGASLYEKRHLATGDYKGIMNIWSVLRMVDV